MNNNNKTKTTTKTHCTQTSPYTQRINNYKQVMEITTNLKMNETTCENKTKDEKWNT